MAHAYTPGLRVTEKTRIVKVRRLPLRGEVLVAPGQAVSAEAVVARAALPGNAQTIKAAGLLGVDPQDLAPRMLKREGDAVERGEVIASHKSLFGLVSSQCKSPCRGTIESVSKVTGQVIIREPPIPVEVAAYLDGTVTSVMEGEGAVVEAEGALIQGIFGVGGETCGILEPAVSDPEQELTPDRIEPSHAGKVLVGGSRAGGAAIRRARETGVKALVIGGIDDAVLRDLLGYDLGVAITGHETLGLTLIVTEGFGSMAMADRTFSLLERFRGRKVSINGATQIRAGVLRPEIVIPLAKAGGNAETEESVAEGLKVGSPVRVIRMPHFGALGEVVELPPELRATESESRVRVLKVRFTDGREEILPRANVEMIEG